MAEEKKIATGHIGNALRSTAADHVTTFADEIFDTERQKYQNEVTADLEATDNEIKADLEAEKARAKAAEEANAQAITDEVARAKAAEEAIIYDVSSHNDGAVFDSISALLGNSNLDTLIPVSFRHGGMTIKYVQTTDNKYVQYRLMKNTWSTDVYDWAFMEGNVYVDNNEFITALKDSIGNLLFWIRKIDGGIDWSYGVPKPVKDYILQIKNTLDSLLAQKVDKVNNKGLIDTEYAATKTSIENIEFSDVSRDENGNIIEGTKKDGKKYIWDFDFHTVQVILKLVRENLSDVHTAQVILELVKENLLEQKIGEYNFPEYIFSVWNTIPYDYIRGSIKEYSREYLNTVYADRLYRNSSALFDGVSHTKILSDDTRWRNTIPVGQNIHTQQIGITVGGNGYEKISDNVNLHTIKNVVAKNKVITVMTIGDSITDLNTGFWDAPLLPTGGNWAYESFMRELFMMDNIDNIEYNNAQTDEIKCHLVGTRNGVKREITYRGYTITHTEDCMEGRASWSCADYLRYPIHATISEGLYDILGLKTHTGQAWSGSSANRLLCRNTCWGVYPPDITEASWNAFRGRIGAESVAWQDATPEQKAVLSTWASVTIVENPDNPFYCKDDYDSINNIMFSWSAYYDRYKTKEDDGETDLVVQGTKAIQGTTVCVPKYVVIELGTNDGSFNNFGVSDIMVMANHIKSHTNAKIILVCPAYPASQLSAFGKNIAQTLDVRNQVPYQRNKKIIESCGTLSEQVTNGIYYCPSYFVQGYDTSRTHRCESLNGEDEYLYSWDAGDVHPGLYAHKQIGYQLYATILYDIAVNL